MSSKSIEAQEFGFGGVASRSVARRQLEVSIGAVAVIAALAIGVSVSMHTGAPRAIETMAATAPAAPVVVKAASRSVPNDRLQANEQVKLGHRI